MKRIIMSLFSNLLSLIAVNNVNSACSILYGQEKEPHTLSRLKKQN